MIVIFVVMAILSVGCDYIVLTKATAEIWEHGDMATTKCDRAKDISSKTIRQVVTRPKL